MNTPEIQARIERLTREHPPKAGMEWRALPPDAIISDGDMFVNRLTYNTTSKGAMVGCDYDHYFRQVPAEAKEETNLDLTKEAEAYALAWCQKKTCNGDRARYCYRAGFIKARSTLPAPAPGLDYERLFEVLSENFVAYSMDLGGAVYAYASKPRIEESIWVDATGEERLTPLLLLRNLPADWTQSLRAREPKPEPDVEPDESTPRLTEVEFQRDGHSHWLIGHLLELSADKPTRFLVLMDDNRQLWVPRCRLRREGK